MVKTVSGNSNNGFKFSDTMSGPSGNYGNGISTGSSSNIVNYNKKETEEIDFNIFSTVSNTSSGMTLQSESNIGGLTPYQSSSNVGSTAQLQSVSNTSSTSKLPSASNINTETKLPSGNNVSGVSPLQSGNNTGSGQGFPSGSNVKVISKFSTGTNFTSKSNFQGVSNFQSKNNFKSNSNFSALSNLSSRSNFQSMTNFQSRSNIIVFKNNSSIISQNEDDWIKVFYEQMRDKENERNSLWNKWYLFTQSYSVYYSDLYYDDTGKCLTPNEYRYNSLAMEWFLRSNGYPITDADNPYSAGWKAFEKYIEEVYTPNFSRHFNDYTGMSYDKYLSEMSRLDNEIAMYKASIYSVEQQKKLKPYMQILETEDFKKFETYTWDLEYFSRNCANLSIPTGNKVRLLDEIDKRLYFYLREKQGESSALKFLEACEDKINQAKGREEADRYLASITKDNGEIDYNLLTSAITAGKGIFDGIESFGEGIANIFATEAMISDNQYAQMYILEALTNPGKMYLDNIINELARVENFRTGSSINSIKEGYKFYNSDGSINLEYAKGKLTAEQYNKLLSIINSKSGGYADIYQISSSIGNMLPSMAVSAVVSILATPTVGSVVGSVLMGASSGGNAKMDALVSGNDMLSATIYGLMSGLSETSLGLLLGNIPGLNVNAKLALKDIIGEGTEELIQTFVDAGLRASLLGEDINITELYGEGGKSFVYGMITSGIMNGGQLTCNIAFNNSKVHISNINDLVSFINILNSDEMTVKKINGKDVIVFNNDAEIDSKTINKIKKVFPNAEFQQVVSNSGATITIYDGVDKTISSVTENSNGTNNKFVYNDLTGELSIVPNSDSIKVEAPLLDYPSAGDNIGINFGNATSSLDYYVNKIRSGMIAMNQKYGQDIAIHRLYEYIKYGSHGDPSLLDSAGDFRNTVINMDYNSLLECYNILVNEYNSQFNNSTSEVNNIKNEIFSQMPSGLDAYSAARYLYLELNKRLNYDANYLLGDSSTKQNILANETSFDTLASKNVVCKGWSELYRELLIDFGFDENLVRVVKEENGNHRWVEIDVGNAIIRADSTDSFNGTNDLSTSKSGSSTNGFFWLDNSYSGIRLTYNMLSADVISANSEWLRGIDNSIGYTQSGKYFNEIINPLSADFYSPSLVEKVFGVNAEKLYEEKVNKILNLEIPDNMDGIDIYNYLKQVKSVIFGSDSCDMTVYPQKMLKVDGMYGVVTVFYIKDSNGKFVFKIISDFYNDTKVFDDLTQITNYTNLLGLKSIGG